MLMTITNGCLGRLLFVCPLVPYKLPKFMLRQGKKVSHKALTRRRFGSSTEFSNPEVPKPPYKVLFAGSDKFSCASLEAVLSLDKSQYLSEDVDSRPRGITKQYVLIRRCAPSVDLIGEVHVLVGPDKRMSRGLKDLHRRAYK